MFCLGDSFDLMDGILGMALTAYVPGEDRKLYYHAMSSPSENWVMTSLLRNESLFQDNPSAQPQIFHVSIVNVLTFAHLRKMLYVALK